MYSWPQHGVGWHHCILVIYAVSWPLCYGALIAILYTAGLVRVGGADFSIGKQGKAAFFQGESALMFYVRAISRFPWMRAVEELDILFAYGIQQDCSLNIMSLLIHRGGPFPPLK